MQTRHVPGIDLRYWSAITCASIFGTNLGDFYVLNSGLGLGLGLLVLVALFAATLLAERKDTATHAIHYWLAIIIIRTGATNIADELAFRRHIPPVLLLAGLACMIAALAWGGAAARDRTGAGLPKTNLPYWGAMLAAGVFGTVGGDVCSHHLGQGHASIALGLLLALLLALAKNRVVASIPAYWCTVALARTAGTCMGDFLAENPTLHLGLALSTLLTGAAFVSLLTLSRKAPENADLAA